MVVVATVSWSVSCTSVISRSSLVFHSSCNLKERVFLCETNRFEPGHEPNWIGRIIYYSVIKLSTGMVIRDYWGNPFPECKMIRLAVAIPLTGVSRLITY